MLLYQYSLQKAALLLQLFQIASLAAFYRYLIGKMGVPKLEKRFFSSRFLTTISYILLSLQLKCNKIKDDDCNKIPTCLQLSLASAAMLCKKKCGRARRSSKRKPRDVEMTKLPIATISTSNSYQLLETAGQLSKTGMHLTVSPKTVLPNTPKVCNF